VTIGPQSTVTATGSAPQAVAQAPTASFTPWPLGVDPSTGGTFAPPPTFTPWVNVPPTFTPVVVPQTPVPTSAPVFVPNAEVHPAGEGLRLRETPGTTGNILDELTVGTPLNVVGRTADSAWVQVSLENGAAGWVFTNYLVVNVDLNVVPVTGTAVNAQAVAANYAGPGVVSGVSSHAREIYLDGLAKGNIPRTFSKVGDSISASPKFLTPFNRGTYDLGDYQYLGGAINFFTGPNGRGQNPFSAPSLAARNGWSTESVLNPANATPGVCRAGESPLVCEYRVNRPAVALIMFGTNDSGGMPVQTFQANMNRIVQISIDMGVIPVLSTIPPKRYNPATDGRVAQFNEVIVATARAYDVPLWNYGAAMRQLPNDGLSADGVHPSIPPDGLSANLSTRNLNYGYPLRNLTALEVLHTLWQQVLYDGDQVVPVEPPAATAPAAPSGPVVDAPATGDCMGAPPPRLSVGGTGRVTPGVPNNVRSAPTTSAAEIGDIPGAGVFAVLDGPVCADGYLWWQVEHNGLVGWTASGNGAEYWVEPY